MINFKDKDGNVVMVEKDNGQVEFKLAEDIKKEAEAKKKLKLPEGTTGPAGEI
jgi:hypothetical protein